MGPQLAPCSHHPRKSSPEWPVLAVGSRAPGHISHFAPYAEMGRSSTRPAEDQLERWLLVEIGRVAELKGDGFTCPAERIFGCLAEYDESWQFGDRQHNARRLDRLYADQVPLRHGSVASFRRLGGEIN